MYFTTLCALCPFPKFSKNLIGHRSAYQTEAVDKNSNWYIGHLKILAPVHSHLENTLFCRQPFGNFWLLSWCDQKQEREAVFSQKRRLDHLDGFILVCNLILLRKCQSAGERVSGHQTLWALKGPHTLTNRALCPYLCKNSTAAASDCLNTGFWTMSICTKGLKLISFAIVCLNLQSLYYI